MSITIYDSPLHISPIVGMNLELVTLYATNYGIKHIKNGFHDIFQMTWGDFKNMAFFYVPNPILKFSQPANIGTSEDANQTVILFIPIDRLNDDSLVVINFTTSDSKRIENFSNMNLSSK